MFLFASFFQMQVYPPDKFCYYNMFNHYFFDNSTSEKTFKEFITANDSSKKLAVVVDPPFGCLVDVMAHSLQKIINIWQELSKSNFFFSFLWVDIFIRCYIVTHTQSVLWNFVQFSFNNQRFHIGFDFWLSSKYMTDICLLCFISWC